MALYKLKINLYTINFYVFAYSYQAAAYSAKKVNATTRISNRIRPQTLGIQIQPKKIWICIQATRTTFVLYGMTIESATGSGSAYKIQPLYCMIWLESAAGYGPDISNQIQPNRSESAYNIQPLYCTYDLTRIRNRIRPQTLGIQIHNKKIWICIQDSRTTFVLYYMTRIRNRIRPQALEIQIQAKKIWICIQAIRTTFVLYVVRVALFQGGGVL
jgi:hypothetical protein